MGKKEKCDEPFSEINYLKLSTFRFVEGQFRFVNKIIDFKKNISRDLLISTIE